MKKTAALILGVLGMACCAAAADARFPLEDGDLWVMLGDSITKQKLHTAFIEAFCRTRFPQWKLRFRNSGVSGDMTDRALARFDWDAAAWNPTVISIELGMNDSREGEAGLPAYIAGIRKIVDRIRAAGARPIILGPSPRLDGRWGRNLTMEQYTLALADLARQEQIPFADQIHALLPLWAANYPRHQFKTYLNAVLKNNLVPDPGRLQSWYSDWEKSGKDWPVDFGNVVHPNASGQLMMAAVILRQLGAPGLVSRAVIDLAGQKAAAQERCAISNLVCEKARVSFQRSDQALPMPIPDAGRGGLILMPEIAELSRYIFEIKGLEEGTYILKIDGEQVATLVAGQLASGWNAALLDKGPIAAQGRKVLELIQQKDLLVDECRGLRAPLSATTETPPDPAKLPELLKQIEALDSEIDRAVQPLPHAFEITKSREVE